MTPRIFTGAEVTLSIGGVKLKPITLGYESAEVFFSGRLVMTKRQRKQMRRFVCALLAKTSRRSRKRRAPANKTLR
jgi:hypothetical protein